MAKVKSMSHIARVSVVAALLACTGAAHAAAQVEENSSTQPAVGAAVLIHVHARVVAIDTDANSVTLQGPRGNQLAVDVDPAVGDVHDLKVGDVVEVAYRNALLVHAAKVDSNGIRERIDSDATTPASGGVTASVRSVKIIATVQKIDRRKRLVTLRGPSHTQVFQAPPEISLDNLKVGDSVEADFVSAAAVRITRNGAPVK
jgi:Cu/Ag efflux protein CusF